MKLSIIIVNYNVKHFLEQCLNSVIKASKNIETEVFVVDNNSVDGSIQMLESKFSNINLIKNKINLGFSKANNQAIKQAKGEYILLLNPDTLVEEDTFIKTVKFLDEHIDAGGLGVKMIDGKGNFLPESKRGLPTPTIAFYKLSGLAKLFPKSKRFGKYHLTYLNNNEITEVDVLSGAFMMMRKSVLDKTGYLDETFFMYGEDIDLSYRIQLAGYKNYYFPETKIIHYKGESTKKSSINYVFVFYQAMIIFAKKHFSKKNANLFSILINIGIYIRAFLSISKRLASKILIPLIDFSLIYIGIRFIINYWENIIKYSEGGYYPNFYTNIIIPIYILIWIFSLYLSGGYDKPLKIIKQLSGVLVGTIFILVVYALLDESLRFSRTIIILSSVWVLLSTILIRIFINLVQYKSIVYEYNENKRIIIVGKEDEAKRVQSLLTMSGVNNGFIGFIIPDETSFDSKKYLGNISQLFEVITIYKIDEIIFCAKDISSQDIISHMYYMQNNNIDYKIAPPEGMSIIGSNSIDTAGDFYAIDINSITKSSNKRNKRMLDLSLSLLIIILLPIFLIIVKNKLGLVENLFKIIFNTKSVVGFNPMNENVNLPKIKKGVLYPTDAIDEKYINNSTIKNLNLLYAKEYKIVNDINIFIKGLAYLGRN